MKTSVNLEWKEKMHFVGDIAGYKIDIDADPSVGGEGNGPSPKPFIMLSLAGCTALDVVSILAKMQVKLDDFSIRVEGITADEHPKKYLEINLVYLFKGNDIPADKVERAIALSQQKYCGVFATLREAVKLTSEYRINRD